MSTFDEIFEELRSKQALMINTYQPALQIMPRVSTSWVETRDGDPLVYALFKGHYSRTKYTVQRQRLFMGPGEKIVLIHPSGRAAFGWRKFRDKSGEVGINNCLFINHGAGLSSQLILEAEALAAVRWPGQRFYTYVNPRRVRGSNPGYCYLMAGWRRCGFTKSRRLLILEKLTGASA